MNLGELEFKREDFVEWSDAYDDPMLGVVVAATANRVLNERLAKASEVECGFNPQNGDFEWYGFGSDPSTHRARLVCIEEIGK